MAAVLPGMAILMFGMIGVYGWIIFSEPRPPPAAKPKVARRRRRR